MTCTRAMPALLRLAACAALLAAAAGLSGGCQPADALAPFGSDDTRLSLRVVDAQTKALLPALVAFRPATSQERLTFGNFADLPGWAQGRSAVELGGTTGGVLAFRHGMALWKGEGTIGIGRPWRHLDVEGRREIESEIPPGLYRIEVTHGVEYDSVELDLDLSSGAGEVELEVELPRTVDSTGYVSADLHVHHAPDSPDAFVDGAAQLKVAAVNGVDVVVSANHEALADLAPTVAQMWPDRPRPIATLVGMEKGGTNSHWGVFPLELDRAQPGKGAPNVRTWPLETFFGDLRALSGRPIVVLNHPRLGWQAYMDEGFCGGWSRRDFSAAPPCPQDYDAYEILNGWQSCGTRMRDAADTWLALTAYNHASAAVGASDSHFVSAMVPGYPRTWVRVDNDDVVSITPVAVANAIRARHTVASAAPLITVRSGLATEGDMFTSTDPTTLISFRIQAANWVTVDTARLLINGTVVKTWTIPRNGKAVDFRVDEKVALGERDAFITVETDSQAPLPAHLVGEYNSILQYGLSKCAPRPGQEPGLPAFAVSSPLFVDRDGDGMFLAPRATTPRKL